MNLRGVCSFFCRIILSSAFLFFPLGTNAQQITDLAVNLPQVVVGQPFEGVISFSSSAGNFNCGLLVSLGDGNAQEIRVSDRDIPVKFEHRYGESGSYAITVSGKFITRGLRSAAACGGEPRSTPIVVTAEGPKSASLPAAILPAPADPSEIRRAALAGDVDAMYQMGNITANQGNNIEAVRWFRLASGQGYVKAMNSLGFMYEEGRGVVQNFDQANKFYLLAIKNGNADAMVNRGLMFARGKGVRADVLQAYVHFLLSAAYAQDKETRDEAVKLRDQTAAGLSAQQISRGQALAEKFAKEEIR